MFRLQAEAKALRFEMTMGGEPLSYIVADEGKIRQALIGKAESYSKAHPQRRTSAHP
jgi:hypothetical protein